MKKIALVSQDSLVNYSLTHLLSQHKELQIKHVLASIDEEKIRKLRAKRQLDLVIVCVSSCKRDGLELLSHLRGIAPHIPVLLLSNSEDEHFLLNFIRCGCKGYLDKYASEEDLVHAIEAVCGGKYYLPEKLRLALQTEQAPLPHEQLSKREFQVFLKFIQRKTIATVARELNVTAGAVSVFRSRVLKKLNFKSNADFIFYALQHHLLTLPDIQPQHSPG
ncbi:response regulator transcription factor [Methylobacillus flagellatus]|uniref:response regulator transcription factor n=1 Tax=Methylobacillus flagellatus TaxID=405 RepID=UPI00285408D6|nr:response regulator transcription factor [Methylobacillus flagellatus]MDR5170571.1 response regulator transcription factor [Methylobacillus flagellatus]